MNWIKTDKYIESGNPIIDEVFKLCTCEPEAYENAVISSQNLK